MAEDVAGFTSLNFYIASVNGKGVVRELFFDLIGKNLTDRLLGSLQIDPCNTFELLKWSPPFTVSESLFATSQWFQNQCC